MGTLLHIAGALVTLIFIAAILYSLISAFRKKRRQRKKQKDLETKQHVQVKNLHQYDITPQKGYYSYSLPSGGNLHRYPQRFTALSVELANEQPYSICLIGLASFENGELKDRRYFYVRPPENKITNKTNPDFIWDTLRKADEFIEYWEAGMKDYFINRTLVAHNAAYVMGCIAHALTIYGAEVPCLRFIDTLEAAKDLYHFSSNKLSSISEEFGIEWEDHNALSAALATGQFLIKAKQEYPMYLPRIHFANGTPSLDEQLASLIASVEREECTAEEMFAPEPVDMNLIEMLLQKKYIEPGTKKDTYYATDKGLDFSEAQP